MKNLLNLGVIVLAAVGLTFCDEAIDALDVEFGSDVTASLPVAATNTSESTYTINLDATADPEVQRYADKIKGVEVTKLQVAVENYSAGTSDEIYFNGTLGFGTIESSSPSSTCPIQNLNITLAKDDGFFEFNACNDLLEEIGDMLLADNAVKVYLIGSVTKAPVSFELKILATVDITANPL